MSSPVACRAACLLLLLAACRSETAPPVVPPPPPADGGLPDVHYTERPDATMDAGHDAATDSGSDGGRMRDAGTDAGPRCMCPTLPATCPPVAANDVAFSPTSDALQRQLLSVLACADTSIHGAVYQADWDCLVDAFLARLDAAPGLQIQLVIDDAMCPRMGTTLTCPLARLEAHDRVSIVLDDRSALMHHKFLIVDAEQVWVSSANFTPNSFCTDLNNSIVVVQPEIVAGYEAEWQRMYTDHQFGPIDPAPPVAGGPFTLYFSPRSPISTPPAWFTAIVDAVDHATTSIDIMVSAFTRTEISDALVAAHGRGVPIRALVASEYRMETAVQALVMAGVPVRFGNVHSKVMIVDGHLVATGSANWSQSAWSNDENSLFIDDTTITRAYGTEMERAWAATPP